MQNGNYQDNVTQPLSCDHDANATADVDPDVDVINADQDVDDDMDPAMHILSAVEKVSIAVISIHNSN